MTMPETEIPEPTPTPAETTTPAKTATPAKQNASADKRAEALRAKKKKKRAAHRVALRRSHTNG
jgi:hypothetical protein